MAEEPQIGKHPTELFGHPYVDYLTGQANAVKSMDKQWCPFTNSQCIKVRKSDPKVKSGTCSLGYNIGTRKDPDFVSIAMCPHRIETDDIFNTVTNLVFEQHDDVKRVKEIQIGKAGCLDYVLAIIENNQIKDFCCVELQTCGTTGTPYAAVEEMKRYGKFHKTTYPYGINWANQYQKTMMQQAYKKGHVASCWEKHILFVVQDVAINYLKNSGASDTQRLVKNRTLAINHSKFIHFVTFVMDWTGSAWEPKIKSVYDTDILGIEGLMGNVATVPDQNLIKMEIMKKINDS